MTEPTPSTTPHLVAPDTWLVPHTVPAGPDVLLMVNSLVIVGDEPIVVDTGAPLHRETWLEAVGSLVDPTDVRWVFLSHDDGDHIGNLNDFLTLAPNATVVANFFTNERIALEPDRAVPPHRQVWLEPGDTLTVGDRVLDLVRPPIFDGPTTRGLFDRTTGVLWAADAFAALTVEGVCEGNDLPRPLFDESFAFLNSLVSPWHAWLDPAVYSAHVDTVQALGATTIASAHGPVLRDALVAGAFDRVRLMAGQPCIPSPGQELLDEILAGLVGAAH